MCSDSLHQKLSIYAHMHFWVSQYTIYFHNQPDHDISFLNDDANHSKFA